MSRFTLGLLAATCTLALAPLAHAGGLTPIDLSPYVNQGFARPNGWFIDGGQFQFDLPGTSTGNQGSSVPFNVANVPDGNGYARNFWFGLDDGTDTDNLFGPQGSVTIASSVAGGNVVHILADNTFGKYGVNEFSVTFHGAGGDLTGLFVGGDNTKDYNTPNCDTTGCAFTTGATDWYNDGFGIVLQDTAWYLPVGFGLTSMTFDQLDEVDGMILAGVSVGSVPEPATWALMIGGFGLMGATLRRRRLAPARA